MNLSASLPPEVLDDDLQLVRATLASICDDVRRLSPFAGQSLFDALTRIDEAHEEFVRSSNDD